jgi:O-antigen ligase
MQRLLNFLEDILLIDLSVFIVISPYNRLYAKFCFFAALSIWILLKILRHKAGFFRFLIPANFLNKPLLLFGIVCAISIVFSQDFYHSQKVFLNRYLTYVTLFWIGIDVITNVKKSLFWFFSSIFISSLFMGLGGIWDYFVLQPTRLYTVFGIRPPFCMLPLYIIYLIPFNFSFAIFSKKTWVRILSLSGLLFLSSCLILQKSRTGWVAVSVSLLFISIFKNSKFAVKIILFIFSLFLIGLLSSGSREMIKTIPYPEQWNHRTPLYASSLAMFKDHPIKGVGLGMFEHLIKTDRYCLPKDYPLMDTVYKDIYLHAHNVYFEILAEMGILGLAAFLFIFAVFFKKVVIKAKNIHDNNQFAILLGLAGTVVATLVYGLSATIITVGVNETFLFWFLFGMGMGLLKKGDLNGGNAGEFSR